MPGLFSSGGETGKDGISAQGEGLWPVITGTNEEGRRAVGFDRGGDAEEFGGWGLRSPRRVGSGIRQIKQELPGGMNRADKNGSSRADREEATEMARGQDEGARLTGKRAR